MRDATSTCSFLTRSLTELPFSLGLEDYYHGYIVLTTVVHNHDLERSAIMISVVWSRYIEKS